MTSDESSYLREMRASFAEHSPIKLAIGQWTHHAEMDECIPTCPEKYRTECYEEPRHVRPNEALGGSVPDLDN